MKADIIFIQFCTQGFLGKVPNRFRTDFLNQFDLRTLIHVRCTIVSFELHLSSIAGIYPSK